MVGRHAKANAISHKALLLLVALSMVVFQTNIPSLAWGTEEVNEDIIYEEPNANDVEKESEQQEFLQADLDAQASFDDEEFIVETTVEEDDIDVISDARSADDTSGIIPNTSIQWSFVNGVLTITGSGTLPSGAFYKDGGVVTDVFDWASSVTKIVIGEGITQVGTTDANTGDPCFVTFTQKGQTNYLGSGYGLETSNVRTLVLPKSLEVIGVCAFDGLTALESVNLGDLDNLQSICEAAFHNCKSLTDIVIPSGVTYIGSLYNDYPFNGCNLGKVTIKTPVVTSADKLGGTSSSTETIFDVAYPTSGTIASMSINWSVRSEGSERILQLSALNGSTAEIAAQFQPQNYGLLNGLGCDPSEYSTDKITKLIIGEGITSIGLNAFSNYNGYWASLKSVSVGSAVTNIGGGAFYQCTNLSSVDLSLATSLETIGAAGNSSDPTFGECTSLVTLDLSKTSVTRLERLVKGSTNLVNFILPSGLKEIGVNAFEGATKLTKLVIPTTVTSVDQAAFQSSSLEELVVSSDFLIGMVGSATDEDFNNKTYGAKKITFCGLTEDDYSYANYFSLYNPRAEIIFQPHQCSAGHSLVAGQSTDLMCSVCGTSAGVSVEKNGYNYDVKVTAKGEQSYLSNPVVVSFPDMVNNFATINGTFYQGVDLSDGVKFSKTTTVETLLASNGLPIELTVDDLDSAPGMLVDHETYSDVSNIKSALTDTLSSAEEVTAFHNAHLVAGTDELDLSALPVSSIAIELPYPVDAPHLYDFSVAHMIDSEDHPQLGVGDIEQLGVSRGANGVRVTVSSLSPFAVSYAEIPQEATQNNGSVAGQALAQTGDDATRPLQSLAILAALGFMSVVVLELKRRDIIKPIKIR